MNLKTYGLAALAAALVMWGVAGIWHEVIMAPFYQAETHAAHQGTGLIALAYLVLGALMAGLYGRLSLAGPFWRRGLIFGAVIGLLWVFPHELAMAGAHGDPLAYVFKNAAWHLVEQALGGLALAWVFARLDA